MHVICVSCNHADMEPCFHRHFAEFQTDQRCAPGPSCPRVRATGMVKFELVQGDPAALPGYYFSISHVFTTGALKNQKKKILYSTMYH